MCEARLAWASVTVDKSLILNRWDGVLASSDAYMGAGANNGRVIEGGGGVGGGRSSAVAAPGDSGSKGEVGGDGDGEAREEAMDVETEGASSSSSSSSSASAATVDTEEGKNASKATDSDEPAGKEAPAKSTRSTRSKSLFHDAKITMPLVDDNGELCAGPLWNDHSNGGGLSSGAAADEMVGQCGVCRTSGIGEEGVGDAGGAGVSGQRRRETGWTLLSSPCQYSGQRSGYRSRAERWTENEKPAKVSKVTGSCRINRVDLCAHHVRLITRNALLLSSPSTLPPPRFS